MVLNVAQWIAVVGGIAYIAMTIFFTVYTAYNKKKITAEMISDTETGQERDADHDSDKERAQVAYYYIEQEMLNRFEEHGMQDQPPPYYEINEDGSVIDELPHFDEKIMPQERPRIIIVTG